MVAVPLASHGDAATDHDLGVQVVAAYAGHDPVLALGDRDGDYSDDIAEIVDADRPGPARQGLVLFFTGLSGSGKSTVAQAVIDSLLERGERTVTSLDGDVVRRNLSAGLTFSKQDRETNIRRIGWVAAEISRHGGVAVCSPIAPFDATRQDVRAMTATAGGAFFLVHVATPLEECERRDRKGLYAKARRGEIPDFTGISSPYEVPDDADLRIDTTGRTIDDCRDEVLAALAGAGYVTSASSKSRPRAGLVGRAFHVGRAKSRPRASIRVLFVCTANICRSPYLELRARQLFGPDAGVEVSSAGTDGFEAAPVSDTMAAEFARWDTEVDGFRSRPATGELIDAADMVLTAEAAHRTRLLGERPAAIRKIFTLGQFVASADGCGRPALHGRALLGALASRRVPASPDYADIADPYRRRPRGRRDARPSPWRACSRWSWRGCATVPLNWTRSRQTVELGALPYLPWKDRAHG